MPIQIEPAVPPGWPFVELRQSLASRGDITPAVDHLMGFIKPLIDESHTEDGTEIHIEIAVREALANAVIHGNRENADKRVHVTCRCSLDGELKLTIRDEGAGFDANAVPDPTDQDRLLRTHGRGIRLMQALMDEVAFQHNGTVVCMSKALRTPSDRNSGHQSG